MLRINARELTKFLNFYGGGGGGAYSGLPQSWSPEKSWNLKTVLKILELEFYTAPSIFFLSVQNFKSVCGVLLFSFLF